MINDLIKLADFLDSKGLSDSANKVDKLIQAADGMDAPQLWEIGKKQDLTGEFDLPSSLYGNDETPEEYFEYFDEDDVESGNRFPGKEDILPEGTMDADPEIIDAATKYLERMGFRLISIAYKSAEELESIGLVGSDPAWLAGSKYIPPIEDPMDLPSYNNLYKNKILWWTLWEVSNTEDYGYEDSEAIKGRDTRLYGEA